MGWSECCDRSWVIRQSDFDSKTPLRLPEIVWVQVRCVAKPWCVKQGWAWASSNRGVREEIAGTWGDYQVGSVGRRR
jgi:hypothetical protein